MRAISSTSRTPIPPAPKLQPSIPPAATEAAASPAAFDLDAPPRGLEPPPPSVSATRKAVPASDPATAVAILATLRVSVESSSKGSGALLVRLLGENDPVPPGAQEALLVPTSAGIDFRTLDAFS
jgi:hypothetical protein